MRSFRKGTFSTPEKIPKPKKCITVIQDSSFFVNINLSNISCKTLVDIRKTNSYIGNELFKKLLNYVIELIKPASKNLILVNEI